MMSELSDKLNSRRLNLDTYLGYDVAAYRKKFQDQPDFDYSTYSLYIPEDGDFESPFNTTFVLFMFLGRNGQYLINEVDWKFGMVEKEFLGLHLLKDMKQELEFIGITSTKQQIQWRMNNVVRRWLPLLDGLTEEEQIEFEGFVYYNFEFLAHNYIEALPDYEHIKIKLRCNGNEAVFLFLCICEDFWLPNTTVNNPIVSRLIAKLEETFQFTHQREKTFTDLTRFRGTMRKFRNGELRGIDDLILTFNSFFEAGKQKFTK
jgi:hypothetical protein